MPHRKAEILEIRYMQIYMKIMYISHVSEGPR